MKKLLALVLVLTMRPSLLPLTSLAEDVFRYDEPITLKISGCLPPWCHRWHSRGQQRMDQMDSGELRRSTHIKIEWAVIPRF